MIYKAVTLYILGLIYNIFIRSIPSIPLHSIMLEKICSPALLYLAFSMIQIVIDLFQGDYETSLLKFIIMFIFTAILNILCLNGYTRIVWFIVIIPIILLTYISSVLFYVFGINPGKSSVRVKQGTSQQQQQQNIPPASTAAAAAAQPPRQ